MKKNNNLKTKICSLFKNLKFNFVKNFKFILAGAVFIVLLASLILGFVGANLNTNNGKYYEFRVEFNTELTKEQLSQHKSDIANILTTENINKFDIINQGELYANSFAVRVAINKNANNDTVLLKTESAKNSIEMALETDFEWLNISEVKQVESVFTFKFIALSILPLLIVLLIYAIYMLIRFDVFVTLSVFVGSVLDMLLVSSFLILFRVPVSTTLFTIVGLTLIYSLTINTVNFTKLRDLNEANNNKKTNSALISNVLNGSFALQIILLIFALLVSVSIMVVRTPETLEIGLSLIIMVVTVLLTSLAITPSVWALTYNRENDNKLQKRLSKTNEKKDSDGAVV